MHGDSPDDRPERNGRSGDQRAQEAARWRDDWRSVSRGRAYGPAGQSRSGARCWRGRVEDSRRDRTRLRRQRRFCCDRCGSQQRIVLRADVAGVRRTVHPLRAARHRSVWSGEHGDAIQDHRRSNRVGEAGAGQSVRVTDHRRYERCPPGGPWSGAISRTHSGARPDQRQREHRSRIAVAESDPRRPWSRRWWRGDGRWARRAALHAAHSYAGFTGDDYGRHA